jgi:hypothetical protein
MDGRRIAEFLKDELVQTALRVLKDSAYADFLGATTEDARVMAQAKAKVVDGFEAALRSVADAGERASIERERREHAPVTRPTE